MAKDPICGMDVSEKGRSIYSTSSMKLSISVRNNGSKPPKGHLTSADLG